MRYETCTYILYNYQICLKKISHELWMISNCFLLQLDQIKTLEWRFCMEHYLLHTWKWRIFHTSSIELLLHLASWWVTRLPLSRHRLIGGAALSEDQIHEIAMEVKSSRSTCGPWHSRDPSSELVLFKNLRSGAQPRGRRQGRSDELLGRAGDRTRRGEVKLDEELDEINRAPALSMPDEINRAPALSMPLCLALSAALLSLPRARSLLSRSVTRRW